MNWGRAWVITRTELRQFRQSRDFILPIGIVAVLFFVVLPAILLFVVSNVHGPELTTRLGDVIDTLPSGIRDAAVDQSDDPNAQASYVLAVYLFAPLAILVPLTVSSAVGAHSIIGERERGTGEFLAHSPASAREIYVGKMWASLLPGYVAAVFGFGAYSLIVNIIAGPKLGGWFFPTGNWWVLVFGLIPPFIALAVAMILMVSSRVSSAAAAQQLSSLITLPLILLAYGLAASSISRAVTFAAVIGAGAWIVAIAALVRGSRSLTRERLLGLGG
ncbi:MAG: ABC transporter permease subunit [Acidimicrobiia bacterium]